MTNDLTNLLSQLADKLGTTTQYLFGVEIKQSLVTGYMNLAWCLILLVVVLVSIKYIIKIINGYKECEESHECNDFYDDEWYIGVLVVLSLAILVSSIFFFFDLSSAITDLINPQNYAIQQIISSINSLK